MRIVVATGLYPPEGGGPAKHTRMMEETLPSHGVLVSVVPFRRVRGLPVGVRHFAYFALVLMKSFRAGAIFAQDTISVGVPAAVAAMLTGKKLVVRVPGDHAWEQGRQRFGVQESLDEFQHKNYGWRVELMRTLARWVVRRAALVIAPSEYLAGIVNGWLPAGKKVRVIYNGIALPVVAQAPSDQPGGVLIASIGRLVPWKGCDSLIAMLKEEPDWHLAIVGDGPERGALEAQASTLGVSARVTFTGQLPNAEALGWAQTADVFVLNSRYEGLSHTLLEVMSLETPIVATDIPGNRELIRDGVHGRLVRVGNDSELHRTVRQLVHEKERARHLGEQAAERARMFDARHTGRLLADALKTL